MKIKQIATKVFNIIITNNDLKTRIRASIINYEQCTAVDGKYIKGGLKSLTSHKLPCGFVNNSEPFFVHR